MPLPTAAAIASCFEKEGASPVEKGKSPDGEIVSGLASDKAFLKVVITDDQALTEELIDREGGSGATAFELAEGRVFGLTSGSQADKALIVDCVEV